MKKAKIILLLLLGTLLTSTLAQADKPKYITKFMALTEDWKGNVVYYDGNWGKNQEIKLPQEQSLVWKCKRSAVQQSTDAYLVGIDCQQRQKNGGTVFVSAVCPRVGLGEDRAFFNLLSKDTKNTITLQVLCKSEKNSK